MDIGKVLTMAKQLKNHFRVFEELEEFMREAVALQNVVKEFDTRKAGLQDDITTLEREKVAFSKSLAELKQRKKDEFERMSADLDEKISTREKEVNGAIEKDDTRKKVAEDEADEMEKIGAETRQRIEQETASLVTSLEMAKKGLQEFKAKLK